MNRYEADQRVLNVRWHFIQHNFTLWNLTAQIRKVHFTQFIGRNVIAYTRPSDWLLPTALSSKNRVCIIAVKSTVLHGRCGWKIFWVFLSFEYQYLCSIMCCVCTHGGKRQLTVARLTTTPKTYWSIVFHPKLQGLGCQFSHTEHESYKADEYPVLVPLRALTHGACTKFSAFSLTFVVWIELLTLRTIFSTLPPPSPYFWPRRISPSSDASHLQFPKLRNLLLLLL